MCIRDSSNVTAAWKAHKKGAFFGNPCFTQIHPTCIPVSGDHQSKLTLMSCLLYTSDAADERSSVDLGGRRIIKKKNTYQYGWKADTDQQ